MMRLFIADDSEMIRTNLVKKLSEIKGIEVVGEAEDSSQSHHVHQLLLSSVQERIHGGRSGLFLRQMQRIQGA